jgi:hypothetical protein
MSLAKPSANPAEIIQDPRVVATAGGAAGAYFARKAAYEGARSTFGIAVKTPNGVKYYAPKKDASGNIVADTSREIPGAKMNRILLNVGGVLLGTFLMTYGDEKGGDLLQAKEDSTLSTKYAGLGFAASSFANLIMAALDVY